MTTIQTKWWDKKWGKNKVCGITQSRLRPGTNKKGRPYVSWLNCGHGFYQVPLMQWIIHSYVSSNEAKCPICREKIN